MSIFTKLGVNVAAPFNADGTPRQISPQDFQIWMTEVERLVKGLLAGAGGVELPELIYKYVITGGDQNNITAKPNAEVTAGAGEALFTIDIVQANSGEVRINGKPLLTSSGNQIVAGGLVPGIWLFLDDGANFRLVSDQASQAIMAAVENALLATQAAQEAAEDARDAAAGFASDVVSQGNVPIYSTLVAIAELEIPAGVTAVRVNGRNAVGDGDGGLYVSTDNGSADTAVSGDGRTWWRVRDIGIERLTPSIAAKVSHADFRSLYTKKICHNISMRGKFYAAIIAQEGHNYIYPQQFYIDELTNELFIVNLSNGGSNKQWVRVVDLATGIDKTAFSAGTGVGEFCVVKYETGKRFIYLRHSDGVMGKYNITALPDALSNMSPTQTFNNFIYVQGCERNNVWTIEDYVPPLGQFRRRYSFTVFGGDLVTPKGKVKFSLWDSGDLNQYKDFIPKRQSIAQGDGFYIGGYGATFTDGGSLKGEQISGVKVFDLQGRPIASAMIDPQVAINVVKSLGISATRWENEGVFVSSDNTCYSAITLHNMLDAAAESSGLLILQEFYVGADAVDFTSASKGISFSDEVLGRSPGGLELADSTSGAIITTLSGVLDAMKSADKKILQLYTSASDLVDIDGAPLPKFSSLTIENMNNATFFVSVNGDGIDHKYLINGTPYAQRLLSTPVFRLFMSDNQTILSGANTKVDFTTSGQVSGASFNLGLRRITPIAGTWRITSTIHFASGLEAGGLLQVYLYKNGDVYRRVQQRAVGTGQNSVSINLLDKCTGSDYYELFAYAAGPGDKVISGSSGYSWFDGELI